MDVVIDTSAIIAVLVNEPERESIVRATAGHMLIGPGSIRWEIGNAFTAMVKRKRMTLKEALEGVGLFEQITVRYTETDFSHSLKIAHKTGLYAYDAYFLDCALRQKAPLLTLDRKLLAAAIDLGLAALEV